MAVLETLLTAAVGATTATMGVVVGGFVARRSQDRHWLRDKQLDAYAELLRHYARFMIELKRPTAPVATGTTTGASGARC